jgi:hypothetical protein
MATCMTKSLCAAASVLLCGALAVAFYNLVVWKGLRGRGAYDDDDESLRLATVVWFSMTGEVSAWSRI